MPPHLTLGVSESADTLTRSLQPFSHRFSHSGWRFSDTDFVPNPFVQRFKRASAALSTFASQGRSTDTLVNESNPAHLKQDSLHEKISTQAGRPRTSAPLPESVLVRIFAYFDPFSPNDVQTCLRAAFVCREWAEPALGVAWSRLPHLEPLWSALLDPGLPKIEEDAVLVRKGKMAISILETESFRDPILLLHWHGNYPQAPIMQQLFNSQALCTCIPPSFLTLSIVGADGNGRCFPDQEWLNKCLELVHGIAGSSLKKIVISYLPQDALWIIPSLEPFKQLHTIAIDQPITPPALRSVGTLKQLVALSINCSTTGDWDGVTSIDLPTLQTLIVPVGSSTALCLLLKALQAPKLNRLVMLAENHHVDTLDEIAALVAAVAASPISTTIHDLTLHIDPKPLVRADNRIAGGTPLAEFLGPWLTLSPLRALTVHCRDPGAIAAGDDDYYALACAWPELQNIVVRDCGHGPRHDGPDPSRATTYHFAMHCRQLRGFSIGGLAPFSATLHRTKELREAEIRKLKAQGRLRVEGVPREGKGKGRPGLKHDLYRRTISAPPHSPLPARIEAGMIQSAFTTLRGRIKAKIKGADHNTHEHEDATGRALQIHEIVVCIIEHFDDSFTNADGLKAACSKAALVSRSFAEPASQMLWRELSPNLDPLWRMERLERSQAWHTQILNPGRSGKKLTSKDWTLIKKLSANGAITELFPALQELHLHVIEIPIHLSALVPRHLLRLDIVIHHDESREHAAGIIDLFREHVPNLRGFTIRNEQSNIVGFKVFYDPVSLETLHSIFKLQTLQSLNLENVSTPWRTLLHLIANAGSAFQDLLSLSVHLLDEVADDDASTADTPESPLPVAHLPRLEQLVCLGKSKDMAFFTCHLMAPTLSIASFPYIYYTSTAQDAFDDLYFQLTALEISPFRYSLQGLLLNFNPGMYLNNLASPPYASLTVLLRPLFSLSLQIFMFDIATPTIGVRITDEDLASIAVAWPGLRVLSIQRHRNDKSPKLGGDASLTSLLRLAQHCPDLVTLSLLNVFFDLSVPGEAFRAKVSPAREMRTLTLSGPGDDLPPRTSRLIARLLDSVFPNLQLSTSTIATQHREKEEPLYPLWEEVVLEILERRYPGMWASEGLLS
ncbi:uncharacterized protein BXZ73DRAFT_81757 [Epithele typhae]|uniref:uncharacterized protein n=1 Tax=Epithele typhae TaxID=378194 RepID=UPI0020077149|nr:uncharacterized protein BXZ73DRAFT_81757 [Epithele typhae]KAH9914084.1 hypothetical protein BXZ73DRAFT_81757 [Epithele typhae]